MKKSTKIIISSVATLVIAGIWYYFALPALNVHSKDLWISLAVFTVIFGIIYSVLGAGKLVLSAKPQLSSFKSTAAKIFLAVLAVPIVILLIGSLISSTFFNAEKYSQIITVEEAVFEEDMPETGLVTNIALMDSASASMLGDRKLGALSHVVSQYELGTTYSQINYQGAPQKVANLEYVDFFKWFNNRDNGVPGLVMVDPVNSSASYVELAEPMKYVESAYFDEDLHRALRFAYPTKIFGNYTFEIDDDGHPFYIVSCMTPKVGLFGAMDVSEVILFDPCDGSHTLFALEEVPTWVDNVFTGELASQKYDWHGMLKNGFWNSIIGNKDCKVTTDDFGYIVLEDDVWFFTGVTSISSDQSNIGFIISNARTGEYKFYPVIGAEEYSAMRAAQGEVQEKGYVASFPSLINAAGEATYIMVLKDNAGLVKLYALVNVENYSIVATGSTQEEAKAAYIEALKEEGIIDDSEGIPAPPDNTKEATVVITDIDMVTVDGNSVIYVRGDDGSLYKQAIAADETLMLLSVGDKITVKYSDSEIHEKIKDLIQWEYAE